MNCINAIALFDPSCERSKVKGTVEFHQCRRSEGTNIKIHLSGLEPDAKHAIHIHEYGDEREGCVSLGGHWNPTNTTHGCMLLDMPSHAGDMINNIDANSNGEFFYRRYYDDRISLAGDIDTSVIGRSVVIHHGYDDLGLGGINPYDAEKRKESLKTGNAGKRMACAIIGRAKDGQV